MTTQVIIKTDSKLKEQAMKRTKEQGLNLTIVINAFLKDFVTKQYRVGIIAENNAEQKNNEETLLDKAFDDPKVVQSINKLSEYLDNHDL